jgi:hypothetical protein
MKHNALHHGVDTAREQDRSAPRNRIERADVQQWVHGDSGQQLPKHPGKWNEEDAKQS